jgi:hypothetical protein
MSPRAKNVVANTNHEWRIRGSAALPGERRSVCSVTCGVEHDGSGGMAASDRAGIPRTGL